MIRVLQSVFIIILTPIAKITIKINDRVRDICIQIICFAFPLFFLYFYMWWKCPAIVVETLRPQTARHILGCLLMLLLIVVSIDRIPRKVQWNKWIIYPLVTCGIWMLIISFLHPVGDGYRAFASMLILGYPCVYFVWNNRGDYEKLFDPLARALAIVCLLVFVYCFYLATQGDFTIVGNRSAGLVTNSNVFSIIGMFGTCGAIYMLTKEGISWIKFVLYSLSLGSSYAIVLMGASRTAAAACLACLLVTVFFFFRYCKEKSATQRAVKVLSAIVLVIFMIILSHICVDIQKTIMLNEASSPTNTEVVSQNTSVLDRFTVDSEENMNTYSSGRVRIWKAYASFFNLTGNDVSQANWDILTPNGEKKAHNNFFEMAYRFGVPLGILFIVLEIIICLKALQLLLFNRTKQQFLLLPILFTVMFLFLSMLDIATLPFERDAPCYFYLAIIPMIDTTYSFKNLISKRDNG